MKTKKLFLGIALAIAMLPLLGNAQRNSVGNFYPVKDNTIYYNGGLSAADSLSNGKGGSFVAGTVNTPNYYRRALICFNVSNIHSGSIVDSVVLKIHAQQNARHDETARHFTLHEINADWGEGTSIAEDPGRGTQAQTNDATWEWNFYPTGSWTNEGGDFVAEASATTGTLTGDLAEVDVFWRSSVPGNELMKTNVQNWVNGMANYGWLIKGIEGEDLRKATMFYSRESEISYQPKLTVYYHRANVATNP